MIKCHLSLLMGRDKVKISELARTTGLNRSTISSLYQETAVRVDLQTIEKLCEFFQCEVSDLFEYQTESELSAHEKT